MVARALWRSDATSLHSPTARAGSPTKAQPCVPLISTMHGQPFLIPLIYLSNVQTWQMFVFRLILSKNKRLFMFADNIQT